MNNVLQDGLSRVVKGAAQVLASSTKSMLRQAKSLVIGLRHNEGSEVQFADVYRDELLQLKIISGDTQSGTDASAHERNRREAWKAGLFGLAFSGGGIRSATFNLGVIQALSELKLLRRVHYLSVVSGGGYIGGWLTALLHRRDEQKLDRTRQFDKWEAQLSALGGCEDPAISHLRNYSNYLTPKKGLATADTWSALATYLRNVLLNQAILVATLLGVFIIGWLIAYEVTWLASERESQWGGALLVSVVASLVGAISMGYNLSSIADRDPNTPNGWQDRGVFFGVILPGIIGATAACVWLPHLANVESVEAPGFFPDWLVTLPRWAFFMILAAVFNTAVWALAFLRASFASWHRTSMARMWLHTLWSGVVAAGLLGGLLWLFGTGFDGASSFTIFVFVPPLMLLWLFLVATLHIGLVGTGMGTYYREWLSRVGAWMLMSAVAWLSLAALTLFGPFAIEWTGVAAKSALVSGWAVTTLGALLASRQKEGETPGVARRLLFAVAPYVFIIGLMALISVGAKLIVLGDGLPIPKPPVASSIQKITGTITTDISAPGFEVEVRHDDRQTEGFGASWWGYVSDTERTWVTDLEGRITNILMILISLIIGVLLLSRRTNVNEFSLRNMYANRLVRCYLGASSKTRYGQPFTGFSIYDDLGVGMPVGGGAEQDADLQQQEERDRYESAIGGDYPPEEPAPYLTSNYRGPYLLINTAVNLSKTSRLAWQERKAASFLISPRYCGFETALEEDPESDGGSYRPTSQFASQPTPISLGDAMATSGAAANPTMGYHTKTAYAVLLALFNVRLGRWVGNPRVDAKWQRSSPGFALWYLIKEAFNSTSDEDGYLQLSDGGHFDNLGLYALVKRRCRYIVCCDAGADGDFKYEDLGNAIRKCRIDLGVDIQIDVSSLRPKEGEDGCRVPCAVGRILYRKENRVGTLVYIKPCKTMDMPSDVINYALTHSAFPHETTADQFFSESQFESYRGLGRHLALKVLGVSGATSVSKLFTKVQQRWYPTRESAAADFTRHAATLDDLFDRLSKDTKLSLLDKQFYPGWRAVFSESPAHRSEAFRIPLDDPDAFRSCFYFCNSLIQLMESVFIDLNFQEEKEYEHPDNRGWMNLFMHWSWSGMFRVTWTLSAATYGVRFQEFCEHVLGLRLGKLKLEQLGAAHWDATKDYHARPDIEQSPSADQSASTGLGGCFNFHEWEQITLMLGETFDQTVAIYQLSLLLDIEVEGSAAIQLPVGYAVVENHQLRMYRVQDQLRKMGLGRNGLRELMKCQSTLALGDKTRLCDDLILIGEADSPETSAEAVKRFDEMYDSVSHELLSTRLG